MVFIPVSYTHLTVIYPSPIFGPVHSRRLGVSLGINLLPEDGKFCTFDCLYCECVFNEDHRPEKKLPTREQVRGDLEARLIDMRQNGPKPDVLTFAGNGDPTAHPHFADVYKRQVIYFLFLFESGITALQSKRIIETIHFPTVFHISCRMGFMHRCVR